MAVAGIVVQKYGGSSVSSIAGIEQVADRILETVAQGYKVVAVVSAMGNTTNELLALAKKVSASPSKRELDLLLSVGERVSMSLLAIALERKGVQAKSFTGSQSGILTTSEHGNSDIVEVRPHRIQQALEDGFIAIVAGFQGMSVDREVTTLGRGGSDTTAVALAAALKAEFCEICSDVSGVYSTDPRVVSGAVLLEELGLERAIAMAKNGAKVLQLEALQWCHRSGITLVANATKAPVGKGTKLLARSTQKEDEPVVAFDTQLILLLDPTAEQAEAVVDSIRYAGPIHGKLGYVIDVRNLHCGWNTWTFQSVGTVTVLANLCSRQVSRWIQASDVLHWWQDTEGLTLLLPKESIAQWVEQIHQFYYADKG